MESIQICKECKGTCHIAFQGLHVCGLVPALETTPVVLDQRKPVSYIGYVQEFGCSDHCTKVPGFYSFTDILRTECLECLHSIMSLAEPHYSWIYYINPKFYETMDDPQSMLFDFFPDAVWKLASIRTNIGQDEINVLKYMEGL
jgi:hypothetical protein